MDVALVGLVNKLSSVFHMHNRQQRELALVLVALILAFLPLKYVGLLMFLDVFTRYSPPRKASTERWTRRLREWWFSIPAAPVVLEIIKEDKKNR